MAVTNKSDSFKGMTPVEVKSAKKIARNSWRYTRADGADCIRLHNTDVSVTLNGETTLNSNGWRTVTTKDRMNCGPYHIHSVKGRWIVSGYGGSADFFDGITLPRDFQTTRSAITAVMAEDKTLKALEVYLKKVRALDAIPMPDGGDCWLCMMFNSKQQPGARSYDSEHLREHLKEGYIFGSLFVVAMKWAGFQEAGIGYWLHNYKNDKRRVLQILRRYLKAQLGVGAV